MLSPFQSLCVGISELQQHRAWIARRSQRTFWGEIYGIDNSQACSIGSATTPEEYLANRMLYTATCGSARYSYNIFKAIVIAKIVNRLFAVLSMLSSQGLLEKLSTFGVIWTSLDLILSSEFYPASTQISSTCFTCSWLNSWGNF